MKHCLVSSALAVLLAVGACQGQRPPADEQPAADTQASAPSLDRDGVEPTDTGSAEPVSPPTSPDTGRTAAVVPQDTAFAGTMEPVHQPRSAPPVATLTKVRTAAHAGYDRIVFEFAADPLPGYHVEYAAGPVYQCGSGDQVSVGGEATLIVRLEAAQAHDDQGNVTIEQRQRILALPALKELTIICDFEAQVEWVAGLAARTPYRVTELSEPPRIVLDVQH